MSFCCRYKEQVISRPLVFSWNLGTCPQPGDAQAADMSSIRFDIGRGGRGRDDPEAGGKGALRHFLLNHHTKPQPV